MIYRIKSRTLIIMENNLFQIYNKEIENYWIILNNDATNFSE